MARGWSVEGCGGRRGPGGHIGIRAQLCTIATTVAADTLFYNVTAFNMFNGFITNQEHDVIPVLIYCETGKMPSVPK